MKAQLTILITLLTLVSCDDIFEKDLTKRALTMLSPPSNFETEKNQVTFWWNPVEGASGYEIQIVDSSFDFIIGIHLDTTVAGDKYTHTFETPGNFAWRIRAVNHSSVTAYNTGIIKIDSTTDLNEVTIILKSPSNGLITMETDHTFRWETHFSADQYRVEVALPDFSNNGNIIQVYQTFADSQQYNFAIDGDYAWRVRGEKTSNGTTSQFSTRSITIDTKAPSKPIPQTPAHKDSVSLPITITWTVDNASTHDSVLIYSDSLSTLVLDTMVAQPLLQFSGTGDSTYFWRVRSFDGAGNRSDYSSLRKFFVK